MKTPETPRTEQKIYTDIDRMIRGTFQCWGTANDLIGHDDIEGRATLTAHRTIGRVALRLPDGADPAAAKVIRSVGEQSSTAAATFDGSYALVENVATGEQIDLRFELKQYETTERAAGAEYKDKVLALSKRYGELDGEISYFYARAFAQVAKTLTAEQKATLLKLRNLDAKYTCKGAYLYSRAIDMPEVPNTDFLFAASKSDSAAGAARNDAARGVGQADIGAVEFGGEDVATPELAIPVVSGSLLGEGRVERPPHCPMDTLWIEERQLVRSRGRHNAFSSRTRVRWEPYS